MIRKGAIRFFSKQALKLEDRFRMSAWTIHSYGDVAELQLNEVRRPVIRNPDEVLVEVKAASLNPIDAYMLGGYGRKSFQVIRGNEIEFPLTFGRDFSGVVIDKGHGVKEYNFGDEVYGFVPLHKQGSFADNVLCCKSHIIKKPPHLSHQQSAALVYATMTAWSSLYIMGGVSCRQTKGLRVLILGGSGGVGTSAIQLLKSQGCIVSTTCSNDATDLVKSLGVDVAFSRDDKEFEKNVANDGKYHIILDAAKVGLKNIPTSWKFDTYITLNSPLLVNNDQYGLVQGLFTSATDFIQSNQRGSVRWGFFTPCSSGFQFINQLICQKKIKPTIQQEFLYADLPNAFDTLNLGHARGKIVINHQN